MTTLRCRVCDREYKYENYALAKKIDGTDWPFPTCHGLPMVVQRITTSKAVT